MDKLLARYSGAATDEEARDCLNQLLAAEIHPLIRETARRNVRNYSGHDWPDAVEEVEAEVLLHLSTRLRDLRHGRAPDIENLRGYVVSAVIHAAFEQLRRRCPGRTRLQNRIRYLLRNDARFGLWKTDAGEWLTGVARWQGRALPVVSPLVRAQTAPLDRILREIFELAGGPIRLGELVGLAAETLGVYDHHETLEGADRAADAIGADEILIGRENLAWLWREVLLLPERQRAALLLNLRDRDGHGVIELLPGLGIASFRDLAAAIGMTAERFAEIWNDLPLEDSSIAVLMDLTRQQVINLRKAARDRLLRHKQKSAGNIGRGSTSDDLKGMK